MDAGEGASAGAGKPAAPLRAEGDCYELRVAKDDFKFNAAHFVAHADGARERLHGHGYKASLRIRASHLGDDGYVIDFGALKKIVRALCKELDERFLCPMRSPALTITVKRGARVRPGTDAREAAIGAEAEAATAPCDQLSLECRDGSTFSFPLADCALLPIAHTSAEELAAYLCHAVIERFTLHALQAAAVTFVEIGVTETSNQAAVFRKIVPKPKAP